jgi:hypothetical protein
LTPDQVGIDKISALLRATPLIIIAACYLAFPVGFGVIFYSMLRKILVDDFKVSIKIAAVLIRTLLVVAAVAYWYLLAISVLDSMLGFYVSMGGILAFIIGEAVRRLHAKATGVVAGIVVFLCAIGFGGSLWIADAADDLRDHGEVSSRLSLIGFKFSVAEVIWRDPKRSSQGRALFVLNQNGDRFFLYDCVAKRVLSIGSSDGEVQRLVPPDNDGDWIHRVTGCR